MSDELALTTERDDELAVPEKEKCDRRVNWQSFPNATIKIGREKGRGP